MSYQVLADDYSIVQQKSKVLYIKIDVLNKSLKTIDRIHGELVEDSFSISSEADIRRTISLTLVVKDKSFVISERSKIWFDKYIKVWIGHMVHRDQSVRYYPVGLYTFSDASYSYDASSSTLSLSCVDLMGELNGVRNGQLSALVTSIPAGANIRSSIISTVTELGGVEKYIIEDVGKEVPYDIEFSASSTVYNMIAELKDLYPGWEIFFDDEIFVCQQTPTGEADTLFLSSEEFTPLVISETVDYSLPEVKNCTEVWGRCISSDYYTEDVTVQGAQYILSIDSFVPTDDNKIPSRTLVGFKIASNSPVAPTIKINDLPAYPIVSFTAEEPLNGGEMLGGRSYVVKFSGDKFVLQGQYQVHSITKLLSYQPSSSFIEQDKIDENCDNISYQILPDSPYCIDKIGEIRNVLSGGEFDNIYSDDLCVQRSDYENWRTTRLTDTITIEMVSIPWLDVNKKVEYKSLVTGEVNQYLIKDISGSLISGVSTVTLMRFYPLYNS